MRRVARWPSAAIASIGNAAPSAYASVIATVCQPRCTRAAFAEIAPMIGPPHGTKTSPRLAPRRKPPPRSLFGVRRLRRASGRSIQTPTCGKIRLAATRNSSAIERLRRKSCGRCSWRSSQVAISVNVAKLVTSPAMIA